MNIAISLLESWAKHIKSTYESHFKVPPKDWVPLEVFHTCHGCGAGAVPSLTDGLCEGCYSALQDARLSAKLFKRDIEGGR
jgi:hypothetical protein